MGMMSDIRLLPEQNKRVETGAIQFGDDWPGLFIRGDNCALYALCLSNLLDGEETIPDMAMLGQLLKMLRRTNINNCPS